jgi:hypothetical protein
MQVKWGFVFNLMEALSSYGLSRKSRPGFARLLKSKIENADMTDQERYELKWWYIVVYESLDSSSQKDRDILDKYKEIKEYLENLTEEKKNALCSI